MLTFAQPDWLWVLLSVPLFIILALWSERRVRRRLEGFSHARIAPELMKSYSPQRQAFRVGLFLLGWSALIFSMARPQVGFVWQEEEARGIDVVFALDSSRSMLAEDLRPNRLDRAKLAIMDLVYQLQGDRVGLIAFAGSAFLQCPLTLDYDAFSQSLNAVDTETIPRGGTDIAAAIDEAKAYYERNDNFRLLILISDGEDLEASALRAAREAAESNIEIHTIGVGNPEGELIPISTPDGSRDYLRGPDGQYVRTALDEEMLITLAGLTNGSYARLGSSGEGLRQIYDAAVAQIPEGELGRRMQRIPLERFQWPLGLAILFLVLEPLIRNRRRRIAQAAILLLVAHFSIAPHPAGAASVYEAQKLYKDGLFKESAEQYAELLQEEPGEARLHYNHGNALYRSEQYAEAVAAFRQALATEDTSLQERIFHNLGNALYQLGRQKMDTMPADTLAHWQEAMTQFDNAAEIKGSAPDSKRNRELLQQEIVINTLALTLEAVPPEGGSVSGDGRYFKGMEAELNASPSPGWRFRQWAGEGVEPSDKANWRFPVESPTHLQGHFVKTWQLTVESAQPDQGTAEKSGLADDATPHPIEAKAADYYAFSEWKTTDETVTIEDPKAAKTNVTLTGDGTVTAHFVDAFKLTVNGLPEIGVKAGDTGFYEKYSVVPVQAEPRPGFEWESWFGDRVNDSTAPQTTVALTADKTVTAHVNRIWNLVVLPNRDDGGSTEGGGNFDVGTTTPITATANEGFRFVQWEGPAVEDPASPETTVTVQAGEHNVFAIFEPEDSDSQDDQNQEQNQDQEQQQDSQNQDSQQDQQQDQEEQDQEEQDQEEQEDSQEGQEEEEQQEQEPQESEESESQESGSEEEQQLLPGQMTELEAQQLFDMLKNDERKLPSVPAQRRTGEDARSGRDW